MKWRYFICYNCSKTFRTTIDNPDGNVKCATCGRQLFTSITKSEFDRSRK